LGIEKVIDDLEEACRQEEKEILEKAQQEADSILTRARHEVDSILHSSKAEALEEADRMYKERIAGLEIELRKLQLAYQKATLDAVYSKVLELLKDMDRETDKELFTRLLEKAGRTISSGKIYCRQKDAAWIPPGNLVYAGELPMVGGLVAESSDGSIRIDYRYETILGDIWEEVSLQV